MPDVRPHNLITEVDDHGLDGVGQAARGLLLMPIPEDAGQQNKGRQHEGGDQHHDHHLTCR